MAVKPVLGDWEIPRVAMMRTADSRDTDPNAPPLLRRFPRTRIPDKYQRRVLEFFNGLGGFASDGREYVIVLEEGQSTPAPWLNVISNPSFGFQVSESGSGAASSNSRTK